MKHIERLRNKVWVKDTKTCSKLVSNKKSTIFVQSSWKFIKMISLWGNCFHQVSWELDKKFGLFTPRQFLSVSRFSNQTLILEKCMIYFFSGNLTKLARIENGSMLLQRTRKIYRCNHKFTIWPCKYRLKSQMDLA